MKKILAFLLVLSFVFSLSSCSGGNILDKIKSTDEELRVVGTAGNYEILYEELRCLTLGFKERMEWTYGDKIWETEASAAKYREQLEDYIMFALTVNSAALKLAADNGITPEDKEIEEYVKLELDVLAAELAENLQMNSSDDNYSPSYKEINASYKEFLLENHLTDHYYRYLLSINGCLEMLKQKFVKDGTLKSDDESIRSYINDNFLHVLHVYIPLDSETDPEKALADAELVSWILNTNLKFDTNKEALKEKLGISDKTESGTPTLNFYNRIVKAETTDEKMKILIGSVYNKDLSISQHGYYFSYGEYEESYENAAFDLEIGECSGVVHTGSGYYIIQRLNLDDAYITNNFETLKTQYHTAYINRLIEIEEENISFAFNDYGKTLDLTKIK